MFEKLTRGTAYPLLRHLTSPVVAITTTAGGRPNGMIANSAQRGSLVPSVPRLLIYISKTNYSHDMVMESGLFGVHLLRNDQWDLIWQLGLQSAADVPDKLEGLELRTGETGCPLLVDCMAAFECRVINAMDGGAATFFLGDIVQDYRGKEGDVMTSGYFRQNMSLERKQVYESKLAAAMGYLEPMARTIDTSGWKGPRGQK